MWHKIQENTVILKIFAKPNAKKTDLVKITDDNLHITIHANQQNNAANIELIFYLSNLLNIPKSQIRLKSGTTSRHKIIILPYTDTIKKFINNPNSFF